MGPWCWAVCAGQVSGRVALAAWLREEGMGVSEKRVWGSQRRGSGVLTEEGLGVSQKRVLGSRYKGAEAGLGESPERTGWPAQHHPPSGLHPHRPGEMRSPRLWLPAKPLQPTISSANTSPRPQRGRLARFLPVTTAETRPPAFSLCARSPGSEPPPATAHLVPAPRCSCLLSVCSLLSACPGGSELPGDRWQHPRCSPPASV